MANIKMKVSDSSPEGRRRLTTATGGYNIGTSGKENSDTIGSNRKYISSQSVKVPITKNAQFAGSAANAVWAQPMFFSPLHTPQNWQIASKRREIYQWSRFYYMNEPKVAAGVDFYANFSMNGFKLECKKKKILKYFERLVERLDLSERLNEISHEYFLLGDVFPFLEITCPQCQGGGFTKDGKPCNHPDGSFKSVKILNPDYMDVKTNSIANDPKFFLKPDEELKMLVSRKEPKELYESLPQDLIDLISTGQDIPLSDRSISHIRHNASPYGVYGVSMLQRLFTMLAYKTKIMTANWIVAERLILPVRVVKVGDEKRPATEEDLQDVVNQLGAVANDPNLTIVTHHAFDYEWYGASGKIHNITQEMEHIGKEILDGLMLNQALLNGEMGGYNSAQVGIEVLIRRLDNWRNKLKSWVEKHIFLPIAMMQGFIDEQESDMLGETVYMYPKLVWNDLQLRDKTNKIQTLMQWYDKGGVSAQTICEELDLDYDAEVEKIREEQVMAGPQGQMPGGGNMGTMGMGDMGGGMPGGDMGGGMPGGDMGGGMPGGGMPGGDMGGGMAGGGMGAAPGMGAAAESSLPKITKRGGGGGKEEEQEQAPPQMIKFTKLEQQMYKILQQIPAPHELFAQYSVKVPGEQRPFVLDFAYPQIGIGVETDGAIWHQREDFQQRDLVRDQKLANVGWRILRFRDDAVDEQSDTVREVISKNIIEATKTKKAANDKNLVMKYASIEETGKNPIYDYMLANEGKIGINIIELPGKMGQLLLIGTI
jgi:very-short-patch-repair endonuclease